VTDLDRPPIIAVPSPDAQLELGVSYTVDATTERSERPRACSRCGRRRVLVSTLLVIRAGAEAASWLTRRSPEVCLDCAGIRRRG